MAGQRLRQVKRFQLRQHRGCRRRDPTDGPDGVRERVVGGAKQAGQQAAGHRVVGVAGAHPAKVGRPPPARRELSGLQVGRWPDRFELPDRPAAVPHVSGRERELVGVIFDG